MGCCERLHRVAILLAVDATCRGHRSSVRRICRARVHAGVDWHLECHALSSRPQRPRSIVDNPSRCVGRLLRWAS
eukprot:3024840-Pyramimonas_sp.AAC.1